MPYAFIQDVPSDVTIYGEVRARLGDTPPAGLVSHVVIEREQGLRFIDVWDSESSWRTFQEQTLGPALSAVLSGRGLRPNPDDITHETVTVVDTWGQLAQVAVS